MDGRAISSAEERLPYKQDVTGSNPVSRIGKNRSGTRILALCSKGCFSMPEQGVAILRLFLRPGWRGRKRLEPFCTPRWHHGSIVGLQCPSWRETCAAGSQIPCSTWG